MHLLLFFIAQVVPWYLFPGTTPKDTTRVPLKQNPTIEAVVPVSEITAENPGTDSCCFKLDIPDVINVTLALPLNTNPGSAGNLDFYCGALLAARDLGQSGIKLNVNAYDISQSGVTRGMIEGSDVFLGPIACQDVEKAAACCPCGKHIISPLDQRSASLVNDFNVIQTPASQEEQLRLLAFWAGEDLKPEEKLIVVLESSADSCNVILNELDSLRIPYTKIYGYSSIASTGRNELHNRYLTASDKEYFASGVVRSVSVLALQRHSVSLYCPAKVRSYENLETELLHNADTHLMTNYFVDYNNPEVRKFVYAYRALFNTEPDSYAFHGYDSMKYFTRLCAIYGREWYKKIPEYSERGLQTGFDFTFQGCGAVNHATMRVVYSPDFSVGVQ